MPTPITVGDVLAFAPELSRLDDQVMPEILVYVNSIDAPSVMDPITQRLANLYLAAHLGTMTRLAKTGAAGPVTSEAAGGLRRAYGQLVNTVGLGGTIYGQQYLSLVQTSLCRVPVVP